MATATYRISNNTGKLVFILDSTGISIPIGTSAVISLTDAGYQQAVNVFGANSVTLAGGASAGANGIAVTQTQDIAGTLNTEAYFQITVTTTAQTLTTLNATPPTWALFAYITPESTATTAIRYRADGTNPTANVGQPIAGNQAWPIQGYTTLAALKLISATGSSVTVSVVYRG